MDLDYHLVWIIDHLKFEEWDLMRTQTVFVSATPGPWELNKLKVNLLIKLLDQLV